MSLQQLPATDRGSAVARHYRNGTPLRLEWQDEQLISVSPASDINANKIDLWVAPALIDIQLNGYAAIDFQADSLPSEEDLLKVVARLRQDACHRFMLTLITCEWNLLLDRLKQIRAIVRKNPILNAAIPGWHIEGPFISHEPGFVGAHDKRYACDPTPQHIRDLKFVVEEDPLLLTLAPERNGSLNALREAVQCGFTVSLGHTNASRVQLEAASENGATSFTHLGNGCPQQLDRHDNLLWRVLDKPLFHTGIIPDGIHVAPSLFRLMHQLLPPSMIWWTTDAMSAASAGPGIYSIGHTQVKVGDDGVVRHPTTGGFAGSSLTPIEGIRRGSQMLQRSWRECWDFFSTNPANLIGLNTELEPYHPAGFVLLSETLDADDSIHPVSLQSPLDAQTYPAVPKGKTLASTRSTSIPV